MRELNWWASRGWRANRTSPWYPPKPTLQIWMDASMSGSGGKTDSGESPFQCTWSEQEKRKHINWLELRAAQYALLELASPRDVVQLHIDNMTAIAFIQRMGGPAPYPYAKRAFCCGEKPSGEISQFSPLSGYPQRTTKGRTSSADTDCRGGTSN